MKYSSKLFVLAVLVGVSAIEVAEVCAQVPAYQRNRVQNSRRGWSSPQIARQPMYGQAPQAMAGTFQRPYPYHLDYYRQRYGGGYEPYFGNLYGSPQIVGTQPFAFSPYPYQGSLQASLPQPASSQPASQSEVPTAAPMIICPHCGEAVQLQMQAPVTQ